MKFRSSERKQSVIKVTKNELNPSKKKCNNHSSTTEGKKMMLKKKNVARFVKWPKFIRVQRQKQILSKKLKIPSIINQFIRVPPKNMTKYVSDTFFNKADDWRLKFGYDYPNAQTIKKYITHGVTNVTNYIRKGIALFVIIAYDVNPIEMIIWLPFLCKKYDVPFMIIQDKKLLGKALGVKKTSCAAIRSHIKKPEISEKLKKFFFDGIEKANK